MSEKMTVKIVAEDKYIPRAATYGSAGYDLINAGETITLKPFQRALIPTGIKVAIPEGYEMQIRPRSGMALKRGLTLVNTPGTIDSDYRGEVGVIMINLSDEPQTIEAGDRIAQAVFAQYMQPTFVSLDALDETDRGVGGYGHTGK